MFTRPDAAIVFTEKTFLTGPPECLLLVFMLKSYV